MTEVSIAQMSGRDARGRFQAKNPFASRGGNARAKKLSKRRRKKIARLGWKGLVERRFEGNEAAARFWWGKVGAHTYARLAVGGTAIPWKSVFDYPGSPEEFMTWYRRLFPGCDQDVAF